MTTVTRNYACIPDPSQNLGPFIPVYHALMVRRADIPEQFIASTSADGSIITLTFSEDFTLTTQWTHYQLGKAIRDMQVNLTSMSTLHLVASKFADLFCIVQWSDRLNCHGCSCPRGRGPDHDCKHILNVCVMKNAAAA